jgi:Ser/Thr protein kinase RdoA (MazF antagonist)
MPHAASFADVALAAAVEAAAQAGIMGGDAELVRVGERAVLRMDGGRVIARVARGMDRLAESRREVDVARWLAAEKVPVTEPLAVEQPYAVGRTVVSLWHAVDGEWTVPVELARLLRRMHGLKPPPGLVVPQLDPFARVDERIEAAPISLPERTVLRELAARLRAELPDVGYVLGRSVIHGDANIGNVLKTPSGEAVLFDLDGVCWGPPEWDLAITAVYRDLGWHTDAEYAEFCAVYGFDVAAWPGYPVLRAVRELRMTCWLSQKAADEDEIAMEVRRRIADLADPARPRRWRPY